MNRRTITLILILICAGVCPGTTFLLIAQPLPDPVDLGIEWLPADVRSQYDQDDSNFLLPTIPGDPNAGIDLPQGVWTRPRAAAKDDSGKAFIITAAWISGGQPLPSIDYDFETGTWSFTTIVIPGFTYAVFKAQDPVDDLKANYFRVAWRGTNKPPVLY